MAYPANVNLIRYGISRDWKRVSFPQSKKEYSYKVILLIKMYFWFRFFFIFHRIQLVQFGIKFIGDRPIIINLVINRSTFKKRKGESFFEKRLLKLKYRQVNKPILKLLVATRVLSINSRLLVNTIGFKMVNKYIKKYSVTQIKDYTLFIIKKKKTYRLFVNKRSRILKLFLKYNNKVKSNKTKTKSFRLKYSNFYKKKLRYKLNFVSVLKKKKPELFQDLKRKFKSIIGKRKRYGSFKQFCLINTTNKLLIKKYSFKKGVGLGAKAKYKKLKYQILQKQLVKKNKKINKIALRYVMVNLLKHSLSKLFFYNFVIKLRFDPLSFYKKLDTEDISEDTSLSNISPTKISANCQFKSINKLPKFEISNIYKYMQYYINLSKYNFLKKYQFSNIENVIYAAVKFRNLQLIIDMLSINLLGKWKHRPMFHQIVAQLNQIISSSFSSNLNNYRLALIGRVNNATRTRTIFFSSDNKKKPNKSNFSNQLYFAETRSTAPIGAFHIKIWFEYTRFI